MTDDPAQVLRDLAEHLYTCDHNDHNTWVSNPVPLERAADEIERLRAELADCHSALDVDKAEAWDAATQIPPKARAEIERLRAALIYCVEAHDTGRFEPARVAYENAKRVLEENSTPQE